MTSHLCRPQHNMVTVPLLSLSPFLLPPMTWSFLSPAKSHVMFSEHCSDPGLGFSSFHWLSHRGIVPLYLLSKHHIGNKLASLTHIFPKPFGLLSFSGRIWIQETFSVQILSEASTNPQAVFTLVEVNKKASMSFKNSYFYTYCDLFSESLVPAMPKERLF